MLTVISPAKTLDYETPPVTDAFTQPTQLRQSRKLIRRLRELGSDDLSRLMKISDNLAELNRQRYRKWKTPFKPDNARQALFAFKGDVYLGLDAYSLGTDSIDYAQQHLRILSGLYGLLRPLDLMQPYRLEMGSKVKTHTGPDLYSFWGDQITDSLNAAVSDSPGTEVLVNLASNEYFKVVGARNFARPIVECVFEDWKNNADEGKIISFMAKVARGSMARFIITQRNDRVAGLKDFKHDRYRYVAKASSKTRLVFRRKFVPVALS